MVGAAPSFSQVHVLRTLFILGDDRVGRKKLVRLLGVGEGSVRTILKGLVRDGLIDSRRQGQTLTAKGRSRLKNYLSHFTQPKEADLGDLASGVQSVVLVRDGLNRLKNILDLRDTAVRAGADGAVLLTYTGGRIDFAGGMNLGDYSQAEEKLLGLGPKEGDVIVVGFGRTYVNAINGALAVVLKLIET